MIEKGHSATGKFYDAYTNLNKELRKAKLRKSIFNQSAQSSIFRETVLFKSNIRIRAVIHKMI